MRITRTELRLAARAAIFRQGEKLFQQNAVKIFAHDDKMVRGVVHDYIDRKITVRQQANGQLSSSCTCYTFEAPCAHVVALLLAHMGEEEARTKPASERPSWENYLQKLQQLQAPSAGTPAAVKTHRIIFFLELQPARWTLRPLRVYIKKSGDLGHRSAMHFNLQAEYSHHEATPAEERALNYLLQRQRVEKHRYHQSFYSYETVAEFDFEYGEEIGYILDLLTDSELYLQQGEAAPRKVRVLAAPGKLSFRLERGNNGELEAYRFFPEVQWRDRREPLGEKFRVLASRPFWLLQDDVVYRLDSSLSAAYVLPFTAPNYQLQIPAADIGAF